MENGTANDSGVDPEGTKGGLIVNPIAYPKRPQFFAHKFIRLMARSCAGNKIGPEACWLLTVIAMTEDAKKYSGPVTYYAQNLADQCGFSVSSMERARRRAVEGGWLQHNPGAKRRAATYWVKVPPDEIGKPDGPSDESDCEILRQLDAVSGENVTEKAVRKRGECDGESGEKAKDFLPIPLPSPLPREEGTPSAATVLEGSGEETRPTSPKPKKPPKLDASTVPIPPELDTEQFREAWADWLADRKARRKTVTEDAAKRQLKLLIPLGSQKAVQCIDLSIEKGWTGLFPERFVNDGPGAATRQPTQYKTHAEKLEQQIINYAIDALGGQS